MYCPDLTTPPAAARILFQSFPGWSGTIGARLCAGDPVPPVLIDGGVNSYDFLRSSPGWTLMLFEGMASANEEASTAGLPVLSYAELQSLGTELKQEPGKDGFIDKVLQLFELYFEMTCSFKALRRKKEKKKKKKTSEFLELATPRSTCSQRLFD